MDELSRYLVTLTNTTTVALSPKAGAHGELCGMMAIKAAIEAKGEGKTRNVVLVPDSAHGTNPATAALIGFTVRPVPAREDGWVHVEDVKKLIGPDVAAIMLTNPNTCGLFETRSWRSPRRSMMRARISTATARTSTPSWARRGRAISASTPCTSTCTRPSRRLMAAAARVPVRWCSPRVSHLSRPCRSSPRKDGVLTLVEEVKDAAEKPFGRMTAFHGQMGMYVRALTYMLSHGSDGMKQASEDAVLNANYIRASLSDLFSQPFGDKPCMHEVLFDDAWLKDTGVTTLDFAKAMIDEGYHPMTMYFPLVVHGAMLIEPTESESKASLDLFIAALRDLAMAAKGGDTERFSGAPYHAPRRRLDETRAARSPVLKWTKPAPLAEAAE